LISKSCTGGAARAGAVSTGRAAGAGGFLAEEMAATVEGGWARTGAGKPPLVEERGILEISRVRPSVLANPTPMARGKAGAEPAQPRHAGSLECNRRTATGVIQVKWS